jgi:hypothetical protein
MPAKASIAAALVGTVLGQICVGQHANRVTTASASPLITPPCVVRPPHVVTSPCVVSVIRPRCIVAVVRGIAVIVIGSIPITISVIRIRIIGPCKCTADNRTRDEAAERRTPPAPASIRLGGHGNCRDRGGGRRSESDQRFPHGVLPRLSRKDHELPQDLSKPAKPQLAEILFKSGDNYPSRTLSWIKIGRGSAPRRAWEFFSSNRAQVCADIRLCRRTYIGRLLDTNSQ